MASKQRSQVSFDVSKADDHIIGAIVQRVVGIYYERGLAVDGLAVRMDITACHANGCPLDLERMLSASVFDLDHDLAGINRHIDHATGELSEHFVPRFASRAKGGA